MLRIASILLFAVACSQPEGAAAGECDDGLDNDGDRLTDCDDPDCSADAACGGEGDADTDADTDTDTDADADADADADTDADADADTDPLPDLSQGLDEEVCEPGPGTAGATTYWLGTYLWDGQDAAVGTERWIWFATSEWEALGGADCEVVFETSATVGSPGACDSCDFSLSVSAAIDTGATTCPEAAWSAYEDAEWSTSYDVQLMGNGSSRWYYHSSGSELGTGHHNDGGQNFVTASQCLWF
jgi:hypothetical protein